MVVSAPLYRNWSAISRVENLTLRLLLCTAEAEILEGLNLGFPQYFSDEETGTPRVPASVLRQEVYAETYRNHDDNVYAEEDVHTDWRFALPKHDIPTVAEWSLNNQANPTAVPDEVKKQLVGQMARCGAKVNWQGIDCCVVTIGDVDYNAVITEDTAIEYLALAPVEFIDLEV